MRLRGNIWALISIYEHMIGVAAIEPNDILESLADKTIKILNLFSIIETFNWLETASESALLLNVLVYSGKFKPKFIIDVRTISN